MTSLHRALASFMLWTALGAVQAQAPLRILDTSQAPTTMAGPDWAKSVCGGRATFVGGARYEWTPVVSGNGQYGTIEAVSGWAMNPHESKKDVPFTHPFGKKDFNYLLLPDKPFEPLLAPRNAFDENEEEDRAALLVAQALRLEVGPGFIGVEQEIGLIPEHYRPKAGERVAVFGRWIVDCGHDNWRSEIHPPLVTAVARHDLAARRTRVDIIANPYLTDQEFTHGGILDQLTYDLQMVSSPIPLIPFTRRVSARANFLPPTTGMQVFSFRIRPPAPPPASYKLYVRMHLTGRYGVVVQPFWVDEETIGVIGLFTDQFEMKNIPATSVRDWDVSGTELTSLHDLAGMAYNAMLTQIGASLDPVKAAVLAQGIRARLIDAPAPPDLSNAPVIQGWASTSPWGQNPVHWDNNQAFPLIGWIEVQWRPTPAAIASSVKNGAWQAVERHLNEIHRTARSGADSLMISRIKAISGLLEAAAPLGADSTSVDGAWRFRIEGLPGQPLQTGRLWLRANGAGVIGAIESSTNGREVIIGDHEQAARRLTLERTTSLGAVQRMVLIRKGARFVGVVQGTKRAVEFVRIP